MSEVRSLRTVQSLMVDPPMAVVRVESSSEGGGAVRPDAAADIRLLAARQRLAD